MFGDCALDLKKARISSCLGMPSGTKRRCHLQQKHDTLHCKTPRLLLCLLVIVLGALLGMAAASPGA